MEEDRVGPDEHTTHAIGLRHYLHVVRRRKWIILLAVLVTSLAALAISLQQQSLYRAEAQVLLSSQDLAADLTGREQAVAPTERVAQTQAEVARVLELARRTLARVPGTDLSPQEFLGDSSVSTDVTTDLLIFSVTNPDPALAQRLVNAYAQAYTTYRRQLDTSSIRNALAGVGRRLARLANADQTNSALYRTLSGRQQTLQTMQALQTANASVVETALDASKTQPKTSRNVILGFVLGLVLGVGLAFIYEALDTRVRSADEIADHLGGIPLLAQVPAPNRKMRAENQLVMLADPRGPQAETFRMLRTNLELMVLDRDVGAVMVTSAVEQEGKSTTTANLGVALARAGRRVALVDLDLRQPFLHRFFDLRGPGVTQVALGRATLDDALTRIAITDVGTSRGPERANGGQQNDAVRKVKGVLEVLPSGPLPPDPGEFVGTRAVAEILADLRQRVDLVLVDTPPMLHVGDAMTLSSRIDGIIVVTRMKIVRRRMLNELGRRLAAARAATLGYVVTDAGGADGYGYGYGYGYGREAQPPAEEATRGMPSPT
jgi:polysaccharide biosynthesis transport protein